MNVRKSRNDTIDLHILIFSNLLSNHSVRIVFLSLSILFSVFISVFVYGNDAEFGYGYYFLIPLVAACLWFPNKGFLFTTLIIQIFLLTFLIINQDLESILASQWLTVIMSSGVFLLVGSGLSVVGWERGILNNSLKESEISAVIHDFSLGDVFISPNLVGYITDGNEKVIGRSSLNENVSREESGRFNDMIDSVKHGSEAKGDLRLRNRNGEEMDLSLNLLPLLNEEGEVTGYHAVLKDVTKVKTLERKLNESLDENRELMSEVHHRCLNNLLNINGLINMKVLITHDDEGPPELVTVGNWIMAIATIHKLIYGSDEIADIDLESHFKILIESIVVSTTEDKEIGINIHIEENRLNLETAMSLSLVINELVNNSLNNGFKDRDEGNIHLRICPHEEKTRIVYCDDGVSTLERGERQTTNNIEMDIIKKIVDEELGGELIQVEDDRQCWHIDIP